MDGTDWLELSMHVMLHSILVVLFLTMFYFKFVLPSLRKKSEALIANTTENELSSLLGEHALTSQQKEALAIVRPIMIAVLNPSVKKANEKADAMQTMFEKYDHDLEKFIYLILLIISLLVIIFYLGLYSAFGRHLHADLTRVIVTVLVSIVCIMTIEVAFFLGVSYRVTPVSSQKLQAILLSSIQSSIASI